MTLLRCIIFLQLTPILALGQLAHERTAPDVPQDAGEMVRSLYSEVVARHPIGIPKDGDMKALAPYLSTALLREIDLAHACEDDYYRHHQTPNRKPPIEWLEFGLFTGGVEEAAPGSFHVLATEPQKDGSLRVYVELIIVYGLPANPEPAVWHVAARVVREEGQFRVDDVVFLKDYSTLTNEFRLSEVLRSGCNGSHWIGYGKRGDDLQQQSSANTGLQADERNRGFDFRTSCQSRAAIGAGSAGFSPTSLSVATVTLNDVGRLTLLFCSNSKGNISSIFVPPQFININELTNTPNNEVTFKSDLFADDRFYSFKGHSSGHDLVGQLELQTRSGDKTFAAPVAIRKLAEVLAGAKNTAPRLKHYSNAEFIQESGDVTGAEIWIASTATDMFGFIVFYESFWGEPVQVPLAMEKMSRKGASIIFDLHTPAARGYKLILSDNRAKLFRRGEEKSAEGVTLAASPLLGRYPIH